jgi:TonB family protein
VEGKVKILRVVKGLEDRLDQMARKAVLEWKFAPATSNGVPVEAITLVDVDFKIPPQVRISPRSETGEPIRMGAGVTPPTIIFRVEPDYTPEARDAKTRGTVGIQAVIHEDGTLEVTKVVKELENGLTDKAIEALKLWKFKPGMKDGKPVAVSLTIEVNFNLK